MDLTTLERCILTIIDGKQRDGQNFAHFATSDTVRGLVDRGFLETNGEKNRWRLTERGRKIVNDLFTVSLRRWGNGGAS